MRAGLSDASAPVDARLEALLNVVMRLAAGDLEARLEPGETGDDVDALTLGINMVAEELEVRERDLRRLVDERTRALAAVNEELQRSNAELEQFAYAASHDLQEPLRMVSSYVQLLGKRYQGRLDADADEFIDFAVDGAKRMQLLITDLLAYSRVGSRSRPQEPVSLGDALQRALANLEFTIATAGAKVVVGPLPTAIGDSTLLTQLFQNLIGNAIKFCPEQPVIEVTAARAGQDWVISVRDNGIGIEAQYLDRIFGLFQRLHTRAEFEGTGIGLAICKKIVERNGGRIWVESEVGRGSTFCFTIKATEESAHASE